MEFGKKWSGRINNYVSSAYFSILINGSAKDYFKSCRGLRQGDPLSPRPFVLVTEAFNILIKRAKLHRMITGFSTSTSIHEVAHLQFADDTVIFCDASIEQLDAMKNILRWFQMLLGLKIN